MPVWTCRSCASFSQNAYASMGGSPCAKVGSYDFGFHIWVVGVVLQFFSQRMRAFSTANALRLIVPWSKWMLQISFPVRFPSVDSKNVLALFRQRAALSNKRWLFCAGGLQKSQTNIVEFRFSGSMASFGFELAPWPKSRSWLVCGAWHRPSQQVLVFLVRPHSPQQTWEVKMSYTEGV